MDRDRVVVTGMGVLSPIGLGLDDFWNSLKSGKNGISHITGFDTTEFASQIAAEIKSFDPIIWLSKKEARRMDRFTQFAMVASKMAFCDAGLDSFPFDPHRIGVIIGSGIGGSQTIETGYDAIKNSGPKGVNPFFVSKLLINMAACMVSITHNLKGPLSAPSVACSTGANAIGDAFRIVQRGDADMMLAGSSEACLTPLPMAGFSATRSMSTRNDDPLHASRPFDKHRDGFVMGEGAGIVVLENLDHARKRNARIYGEMAGYGNTADAYHFTSPQPQGDGMIRVMTNALADAHMAPSEIGYVNAHGTSTKMNDMIESDAIAKVFASNKDIKVSSNKSMFGHLLAAAGSVEFIATAMSVYMGILPPTINYTEPDPECSRLDYIPNEAIEKKVNAGISNSFGFGGGNVSLVFKKHEA